MLSALRMSTGINVGRIGTRGCLRWALIRSRVKRADRALAAPERPLVAVVGGSKVSLTRSILSAKRASGYAGARRRYC